MNIKDRNQRKPQKPLAIGVTGGAGAGKSLVLRRLMELGVSVLSADRLARQAVEPGTRAYGKIVEYFGGGILAPDGSIDRSALRGIIIKDDESRRVLESFVHPEVVERIAENLNDAGKKGARMVAVEVPLLFEAGLQKFFDCVVMVSAERENRIARIMTRDKASRRDAEALIETQMPEPEKRRLADFVVENNGSPPEAYRAVDRIYGELAGRLKKKGENG